MESWRETDQLRAGSIRPQSTWVHGGIPVLGYAGATSLPWPSMRWWSTLLMHHAWLHQMCVHVILQGFVDLTCVCVCVCVCSWIVRWEACMYACMYVSKYIVHCMMVQDLIRLTAIMYVCTYVCMHICKMHVCGSYDVCIHINFLGILE